LTRDNKYMPDETNTIQEATESPISQDAGVNMGSDTPETPPEAINAPVDNSTPEVVNNTAPINTENKAEMPENGQNTENTLKKQEPDIEPKPEPVSEPVKTSETGTAQIPVNEPLVKISLARELLIKARNMIQSRKRKKLDKIMTLFLKNSKITNDEVEKFLHVSDATAERYLNILEKENKIKQIGKTGHSVSYSKI